MLKEDRAKVVRLESRKLIEEIETKAAQCQEDSTENLRLLNAADKFLRHVGKLTGRKSFCWSSSAEWKGVSSVTFHWDWRKKFWFKRAGRAEEYVMESKKYKTAVEHLPLLLETVSKWLGDDNEKARMFREENKTWIDPLLEKYGSK